MKTWIKNLSATDKLFWKTVKPFLSDKINGKNKIHSTEKD